MERPPSPSPGGDDALQTKVVSGVYVQTPMYLVMKFSEVAPDITEMAGAYTPMLIFMDLKRFEKLPDFAKQAIEKAAREIQANSFKIDTEGTKPWAEKLKTSNVKVFADSRNTP